MIDFEPAVPYTLLTDKIVKIEVSTPSFVGLANIVTQANALQTSDRSAMAVYNTVSIQERVVLITEKGERKKPDFITISGMPPAVAKQCISKFNILMPELTFLSDSDADGMSKAIHIKLTEPIKAFDPVSKAERVLDELEFFAKTYGELEAVLGEISEWDQALALIRTVAKPIGMLKLPDWAVSGVSAADGFGIMKKILPRFL